MARIQFLLEIQFFNEIGFVEKIEWILRQFFHVGINTTKYKIWSFFFKYSIFTWIVAHKMGKLDAEASNVGQHRWGSNGDRLRHTFQIVTGWLLYLYDPCVCLWKPNLTSHAKTRIPLGNNWIFPILFRIITEESDVADARRNRQIRHLVKS